MDYFWFAALLGFVLFGTRFLRQPPEVVVMTTFSSIVSLLYLGALAGLLRETTLALKGMGLGGLTLTILARLFAAETSRIRDAFPFPLVLFSALSAILYLGVKNATFAEWDEFSHWGLAIKVLLHDQHLPTSESAVVAQDYPPGITLFQYLWCQVWGYSEATVYWANGVLILAAGFPFLRHMRSWKNIFKLALILSFIYFSHYTFNTEGFLGIYVDGLMGILFGSSLARYFLANHQDKRDALLSSIPILLLLTLTKTIGIVLALIAASIVAVDYGLRAIQTRSDLHPSERRIFAWKLWFQKKPIILFMLLFLLPAIFYGAWSDRIQRLGLKSGFTPSYS